VCRARDGEASRPRQRQRAAPPRALSRRGAGRHRAHGRDTHRPRPNATSAATVGMTTWWSGFWNTKPDGPSASMLPPSSGSRPPSTRSSVDLPQPLGPSSMCRLPRCTCRLTPRSTWRRAAARPSDSAASFTQIENVGWPLSPAAAAGCRRGARRAGRWAAGGGGAARHGRGGAAPAPPPSPPPPPLHPRPLVEQANGSQRTQAAIWGPSAARRRAPGRVRPRSRGRVRGSGGRGRSGGAAHWRPDTAGARPGAGAAAGGGGTAGGRRGVWRLALAPACASQDPTRHAVRCHTRRAVGTVAHTAAQQRGRYTGVVARFCLTGR
jgi:hypothetical protein